MFIPSWTIPHVLSLWSEWIITVIMIIFAYRVQATPLVELWLWTICLSTDCCWFLNKTAVQGWIRTRIWVLIAERVQSRSAKKMTSFMQQGSRKIPAEKFLNNTSFTVLSVNHWQYQYATQMNNWLVWFFFVAPRLHYETVKLIFLSFLSPYKLVFFFFLNIAGVCLILFIYINTKVTTKSNSRIYYG